MSPRRSHPFLAALIALATAAPTAAGAGSRDRAMLALARANGCLACHSIDPGARGSDGRLPVGPAWRDVAARYRGQKGAAARLAQIVIAGSDPYHRHWKGEAAGLAMPPNAVAVKAADARRLVRWILALKAPAPH